MPDSAAMYTYVYHGHTYTVPCVNLSEAVDKAIMDGLSGGESHPLSIQVGTKIYRGDDLRMLINRRWKVKPDA